MTEGGEIISLKVGELIDIEEPIENNPEDQKKHRIFNKEYTEEIEVSDKPVQKTKKHRVFDGNEKDLVEEEVPDDEDKRSSKNKKHRVFDKNKKDKGIFDWLF